MSLKPKNLGDQFQLSMLIIFVFLLISELLNFSPEFNNLALEFIIKWFMIPTIYSAIIALVLIRLKFSFLEEINVSIKYLGFTITLTLMQIVIKILRLIFF